MPTPMPNRKSAVIEGLVARGLIRRKSDAVDIAVSDEREKVREVEKADHLDHGVQMLFDLCELMGFEFFDAMRAELAAGAGPATIARYKKQIDDARNARQIADEGSA